MQLLLDTSIFIWFINGNKELSGNIRHLIEDIGNDCYLSIASLWEISLKISLGKLDIKSDFNKIADFLQDNKIELLPISFESLQTLLKLPFIHRDPFDRIIIAQSISEGMTLLTSDQKFKEYPIKIII